MNPVEHAELLADLENQYPQMVATLEKYGLMSKRDKMPSWEQIKNYLNADILEKTLKLEEPTLIIIPPVSRQGMVNAINTHKVKGKEYDTYTSEFENDDLWNGGKLETNDAWEVAIVTGVQDVKADKAIKGTNYQRAKAWVRTYADQGVDVINNSRTYLTLMMRSLAAGKPIDIFAASKSINMEGMTILNALNVKNLNESSYVAYGYWNTVQVRFGYSLSYLDNNSNLRVRGLVRVI